MTPQQKNSTLNIRREWCKGCGICIAFCPKKILDFGRDGKVEVINEEECSRCGLCEERCPDYAIKVEGESS